MQIPSQSSERETSKTPSQTISIKARALALLAALALFGIPLVTQAADPGTGLTVSPISQELTLRPGTTAAASLKLYNPTDSTVVVSVSASDFKAKNASGEPAFYVADQADPHAMSRWFHFKTTSVTVAPNTTESFSYSITAPSDAEPGGHYGAVFFTAKEGIQGAGPSSSVQINPVVGSLILIRVPGTVVESAQVASFASSRTVYTSPSITLTTNVRNTGSIHVRPFGEVIIKDWQKKTVATMQLNQSQGAVLPDSTREFIATWKAPNRPGLYTAQLAGLYGENHPLSGTITLWVIPTWAIGTAGGLLAFLMIATFILSRFRFSLR